MNTHMEPVLKVVASKVLLHGGQTGLQSVCFSPNAGLESHNPARLSVLPGRKKAFTKGALFPTGRTEGPVAPTPPSTGCGHP